MKATAKKAPPTAGPTAASTAAALSDRRPAATVQHQAQAAIAGSPQVQQAATLQRAIDGSPRQQAAPAPLQRPENSTGLPDHLKAGVENLSGHSLDDVRVHYNSAKPAQLQAHAYAQGSDIHVAPGQEQHLPHEAWHVVQQKQGRVRPTTQLKGQVAVNDDAGLEREADVMGAQALRAPGAVATTQLRARATTATGPVQLVIDKTKRTEHSGRIDALKEEAIQLLQEMGAAGQDWERTYGEQGKAKAEDVIDGKKTDYKAELRKAALNKLWESMSPSQKLEVAKEAAKMTGKAIGAAWQGGSQAASALLEPGGKSGSKQEKEDQPTPRKKEKQPEEQDESGSSLNVLSELSLDQLNALRKAYSFVNEGLQEYEKAKNAVREKAGEFGAAAGGQVGKLRDYISFKSRMSDRQQAFIAIRQKYRQLEAAIEANEDSAYYQNELDALGYSLININGPAKVYLSELSTEDRKKYPQACQEAIDEINASSHGGVLDTVMGGITAFVGGAKKALGIGKEEEAAKLQAAQGELAGELSTVANKGWGKFTTFYSMPNTVAEIRKSLLAKPTPKTQLQRAMELAKAARGQESRNRSPETQNFYDALATLDIDDLVSVKITKSTIAEIGAKLS
jgi:uncharacterized coiled-coil DUF342 family protein